MTFALPNIKNMNTNQFTIKTQDFLQAAQQKAVDLVQQQVENSTPRQSP